MLYYPQTNFDAQEFLDKLALECLICKNCCRAKLIKEYGKTKGYCGDIDNNGEPLYPNSYLCPLHEVYSKLEDAAYALENTVSKVDRFCKELEEAGGIYVQSLQAI